MEGVYTVPLFLERRSEVKKEELNVIVSTLHAIYLRSCCNLLREQEWSLRKKVLRKTGTTSGKPYGKERKDCTKRRRKGKTGEDFSKLWLFGTCYSKQENVNSWNISASERERKGRTK